MLLSLFPIPLLLADYATQHVKIRPYLTCAMAGIALTGIIVFTHGTWFF
jgi:hypothetical protein